MRPILSKSGILWVLLFLSALVLVVMYGFKSDTQDLYLMYSTEKDLYKIGISIDPERRVSQIERKVGSEVILVGVWEDKGHKERILHKHYDSKNVPLMYKDSSVSREWFDLNYWNVWAIKLKN